jgi:tRNA(fMet)-specific endonuclease VapC
MAIILDSGVIIAGERGTIDLEFWLASYPAEPFEVAAITIAELWHGVERAPPAYKQKRESYLQSCLASILVVPYTEQTAREHARLWAELETSGTMIGDYDLIVAATALERGNPVATFNKKHFSVVKGLTVIEPF